MANKGDWVRIHNAVLKAEERTAKIPEDTQKCDLEMWVKGALVDDSAEISDFVTVEDSHGKAAAGHSGRGWSLLYPQLRRFRAGDNRGG